MVHWIISDLPLDFMNIFTYACTTINVLVFVLEPSRPWLIVAMILLFTLITILIASIINHFKQKMKFYDENIEKIIIPEFIEKRPFREANLMQKDEILAVILRNVNTKFVSEMKKQYIFKNIKQLVEFYDDIIAAFTKRYFERYKDLPLEDIQGRERMLLVAKNIQDEDLKDLYADLVSPDILQTYSCTRPTTRGNGIAKRKHL